MKGRSNVAVFFGPAKIKKVGGSDVVPLMISSSGIYYILFIYLVNLRNIRSLAWHPSV